jgi:hypothetical protein
MLRRAIFFGVNLLAVALQACPGCKDALSESPNSQGLWKGFYTTILLLLGMVFSMVGLLIYKIVLEARKESTHV